MHLNSPGMTGCRHRHGEENHKPKLEAKSGDVSDQLRISRK